MKRLFKFKYPKIVLLIFFIVITYFLFSNPVVRGYIAELGNLSYIGLFIGGALFAFGFTAPIGAGFFITANPENLILATIVGALGAVAANLFLFSFIKFSFAGEFNKLLKSKLIKKAEKKAEKEEEFFFNPKVVRKINHYLIYVFAGILIASPLPDEFGTIMLTGLMHVRAVALSVLTFVLSSIGIFILFNI
ncbi:MAG: hypothetical protein WC796_05140 [Candidatus Pacearchaeota archaeon]|jgi:hypothetical protein